MRERGKEGEEGEISGCFIWAHALHCHTFGNENESLLTKIQVDPSPTPLPATSTTTTAYTPCRTHAYGTGFSA